MNAASHEEALNDPPITGHDLYCLQFLRQWVNRLPHERGELGGYLLYPLCFTIAACLPSHRSPSRVDSLPYLTAVARLPQLT